MRSFLERGKEKGGGDGWDFGRLCHKWRRMLKTQIAIATTAAATTTMLRMFACNLTGKTFEMLQKKRQKLDYVGGGDGDLEWLQVIKYTAQQDKHRKDNTQTAKNPSPVSPENVRVPFPGSPELQSHFWHMSPHNHICNYRTRGRQAVTLKTF